MDRRAFLKTAGAAAFAALAGGIMNPALGLAATPDVAMVTGPSPEAITRAAVDALGGMRAFVGRGSVVVVKPNIGWDRTVEQAANTNPIVLSTVVKMCLEAGAKTVKIFDRPVNDPRRCYVQSGIKAALDPLGVDLKHPDERRFRDISIKGEALKTWPLYTEALECDCLINVPIAKHHGLATLTMAMKNWMGVMGGNRSLIHQKLDLSLVDVARHLKPTLTVLDAVRILTANGPQGGSLADVKLTNTVIAGVDQVAVDAVGSTLFGMEGSTLGYVREATRQGMGVSDLKKLNIKKLTA